MQQFKKFVKFGGETLKQPLFGLFKEILEKKRSAARLAKKYGDCNPQRRREAKGRNMELLTNCNYEHTDQDIWMDN